MPDLETAVSALEESIRHLVPNCKFQKTGSPDIFCSRLPPHWRSNKSLPSPFVVIFLSPVADGTKVTVTAGNEENDTADVKNHVAEVIKQVARFSDLRFVGKSGRGKNFNVTITVHHSDVREVAVVPGVIKVTVDGPRDSRNANKCPYNNNPFEYRKRPISMAPFDSLNLAHTHPSISGTSQNFNIFDFKNPTAAKRPRLSHPINPSNPTIPNVMDLLKPPFATLPPPQQLLLNPSFMMAAMNSINQPYFLPPNMSMNSAWLLAAALAQSLHPPPSSDPGSDDAKSENKIKLECETEKPLPENAAKHEDKKVWRPFLSTE